MDAINILCWNCMAVSNKDTINRIKELISNQKLMLVCLDKTRVEKMRVYRFCSLFQVSWDLVAILAEVYSRGIIIISHRECGIVTPISKSHFCLQLVIFFTFSNTWILSIIYNSYRFEDLKYLDS